MQSSIDIVNINRLRPHEEVDENHLKSIYLWIERDGFLDDPLIVDKNTNIILDGHHRCQALILLGNNFSPIYYVDYTDFEIKVVPWREGEIVSKQLVINAGNSGKLLPYKTSRHLIPNRPSGFRISLSKIRLGRSS